MPSFPAEYWCAARATTAGSESLMVLPGSGSCAMLKYCDMPASIDPAMPSLVRPLLSERWMDRPITAHESRTLLTFHSGLPSLARIWRRMLVVTDLSLPKSFFICLATQHCDTISRCASSLFTVLYLTLLLSGRRATTTSKGSTSCSLVSILLIVSWKSSAEPRPSTMKRLRRSCLNSTPSPLPSSVILSNTRLATPSSSSCFVVTKAHLAILCTSPEKTLFVRLSFQFTLLVSTSTDFPPAKVMLCPGRALPLTCAQSPVMSMPHSFSTDWASLLLFSFSTISYICFSLISGALLVCCATAFITLKSDLIASVIPVSKHSSGTRKRELFLLVHTKRGWRKSVIWRLYTSL
mmetsp:Transcript_47711/g.123720  ORF Transcript_47711/g.123720 Transcript_47711/m.123720 type:complete len:351 (+) Transcript_47711:721-1773(+)